MTGEQLLLDLPRRAALGREDFLVSPANATALAQLDAWPNWPVPRLALCGPQGSGKSHLARVWAAESGALILTGTDLAGLHPGKIDTTRALVIDDADRMTGPGRQSAETTLFHLYNLMGETATPLVLTGTEPPARWTIALPDLASRLASMPVAQIGPPDDSLLEAIMVKLFADRQISVTPDVVSYLLTRIDRSVTSAAQVIDALDQAALRDRRAVTRPFATEVLRLIVPAPEPS